ncbi:MAG: AarF/UbiB family protein [Chloroflexota bacterium]|nr:AarF/UbiB family protein [Dehalococcoidia bacterium]MDW8252898.1 AarF/UbiB family protein [Chloroflexota bacterium]
MTSYFLRPWTAARSAKRFREIANILARHGFGFILDYSGLQPWPIRLFGRRKQPPYSAPERLRLVIEEIGPTAIKLGQVLSTRPDFVPPDLLRELIKLQDTVPPFPFADVVQIVREEFGREMDAIFLEFDETPVAAASLAQVHRARLRNGVEVAVKVQRPGIVRQIETDIDITLRIAQILERRTEWARAYNLTETAEEFARTIREELDFTSEGRNIELFARTFAGQPGVIFPSVFWEYTTRRILTMRWIGGFKITDTAALAAAGIDRRRLARRFAEIILEQVLIHGFFHADPHPGNVLVTPDGKIAFLDFGMVGYLDESLKEELVQLVLALVRRDVSEITRELLDIGVIHERIDFRRFRADLARLLRRYYNVPLRQIPISDVIQDTLQVAYRYHLQLPADLALLGRAMSTMEGVALTLDPDISIVSVAEPFGRRLMAERFGLGQTWEQIQMAAVEYLSLARLIPKRVDGMLSLIEKGELRINTVPALPDTESGFVRLANRIVLALVVVAGIISSVILLSFEGRDFLTYAGIGMMLFTGVLALWLAFLTLHG